MARARDVERVLAKGRAVDYLFLPDALPEHLTADQCASATMTLQSNAKSPIALNMCVVAVSANTLFTSVQVRRGLHLRVEKRRAQEFD